MILQHDLLRLLDQALGLDGRGLLFEPQTRLMGALPELDPMGVVALPTALEDRFGLSIDDDEIDASVFATVATLTGFVQRKLAP